MAQDVISIPLAYSSSDRILGNKIGDLRFSFEAKPAPCKLAMGRTSERVRASRLKPRVNFENGIRVNVPGHNLLSIVTVKCGHCGNLLSVNVSGVLQTNSLQGNQKIEFNNMRLPNFYTYPGSTSSYNKDSSLIPIEANQQRMLPIRPPEKRQRVPSAYNRFIKEEIQRIKTSNPNITHREAFSAAAKNWAHFPHIHFGLNFDGNKQGKCDEVLSSQLKGQKI
ncbi:hypothetical protein HPP92_012156 [Vanilla planifolia]|uniref:Uncharacterized protein n=1 Tax=Vanilla planifolia TaxID=51239 RepID=A0A835V1G6_VANPL|nr:hypothetical protein HPP92_012156 [Vanilla planifolia]